MNKLTSKNLSKLIHEYPTKYPYGFLGSETNEILEKYEINKDLFHESLGVNTCMLIEGKTLNYHHDIELALRCVIENRGKKIHEWD